MTEKIEREVAKYKLEILREAANILIHEGHGLLGAFLRDAITEIREEMEQNNGN